MNSKEKHNINTVFAISLSRAKQSGETTTPWHGIKGLYMIYSEIYRQFPTPSQKQENPGKNPTKSVGIRAGAYFKNP